jgi:hypothetical protein
MQLKDKPTKRVGDYVLFPDQLLGKGSFGEVVIAAQENKNGLVACKIIHIHNKTKRQL